MADEKKIDETEKNKVAETPAPAADPARRNKLVGLLAALAVLAIIVVVVLVAQGGGDDEGGGDVSTDLSTKPVIEPNEGEPPTELETTDIVEGDGAEATPGSTVTVQYVGGLFETGEEFDASWDRGEPFEFQLGSGAVIPGWDQGIPGMKVGGRRELVIPAVMAYGAAGRAPSIGPDEDLVFIVDVVDIVE